MGRIGIMNISSRKSKKIVYFVLTVLTVILTVGFVFQDNLGYTAKENRAYFSQSIKELKAGLAFTFKVSNVGNNRKIITWSSSNPDIARVSVTGKVTAIKQGTAVITARILENEKRISQELAVVETKGIKKTHESIVRGRKCYVYRK